MQLHERVGVNDNHSGHYFMWINICVKSNIKDVWVPRPGSQADSELLHPQQDYTFKCDENVNFLKTGLYQPYVCNFL